MYMCVSVYIFSFVGSGPPAYSALLVWEEYCREWTRPTVSDICARVRCRCGLKMLLSSMYLTYSVCGCLCVSSQELMSRTSLETQKLDLIDEVSYLKLKLVSMEETHTNTQPKDPADTEKKKAEVWAP